MSCPRCHSRAMMRVTGFRGQLMPMACPGCRAGKLIKQEQEAGRLATEGRPDKGNNVVTFLKLASPGDNQHSGSNNVVTTLKDYGINFVSSWNEVRRAGEMLAEIERTEANQYSASSHSDKATYSQVCDEAGLHRQTAERWQLEAEIPSNKQQVMQCQR